MSQYRKEWRGMETEYTYIEDGNTIRKMEAAVQPEARPEERVYPKKSPKKKQRRHAHAQRLRGMDMFSVLFLTAMLIVTGICCVKYLKMQTEVTHLSQDIAEAEKQIVTMKEENKTERESITADIDLDHIYKVATKKLGMVHPSKKQVVKYKSTKSDTVQQYGDIPSGTKDSLVDSILK